VYYYPHHGKKDREKVHIYEKKGGKKTFHNIMEKERKN